MEFTNGAATVILADGTEVTIRQRTWQSHPNAEYWAKSRVFIWGVTDADNDLAKLEAALPAPKTRGEDPENDKAYAQFNRAYIKAWKAQAGRVLTGLTEFGAPGDLKDDIKFSRKAGCSMCPCSPGGILNRRVAIEDAGVDFYVTLPKASA